MPFLPCNARGYSDSMQGVRGAYGKAFQGANEAPFSSFTASFDSFSKKDTYESTIPSKEMRELLRGLKQTRDNDKNPFAATSEDKVNGFLELSGAPESEKEDENNKPINYNYKEVATKIQRAKTSVSAGQAVLSAKRKVLEMKRKIAAGNGDPDELQAALTHAKRMEMVARKKKHHLELEEMAATTGKRDEKLDRMKEASADMKNAIVNAEEEKVSKKEDDIFKEREEMLDKAYEEYKEGLSSEDTLEELGKMISEFGEDELKELEESMEMLENMEIINPHMDKEDLEELKRKHRTSENKALVKADMDYLKSMIKHQLEGGVSVNTSGTMGAASASSPQGVSMSFSGASMGVS